MKHPTLSTRTRVLAFGASLALLALAGCSGGGAATGNAVSAGPPGSVVEHPDANNGSRTFVVDSNSGGSASSLELVQVLWGRLVDVYDENDELQNVDFVVGEDIVTDNVDFRVTTNPVTAETRVTILHEAGSPGFESAFRRLDRNLVQIQKKGLASNVLPPFSLGPRNAAFVLRFNDLLAPSAIGTSAVRLLTGTPPQTPYSNLRVFPDPNHGDLGFENGQTQFFSTRVIVDPTISSIDILSSSQPLQVNAAGLPPSFTTSQPNAVFRLPTRRILPADQVLTNLDGRALDPGLAVNQPIESNSLDVVRSFRTGGDTTVTGDPRNGFLLDLDRPQILGTQPARVTAVSDLGGGEFLVDVAFDVVECTFNPRLGDVIQQQCRFAEVVGLPVNPPSNGVVSNLRVRLLFPQTASDPCSPDMIAGAVVYRAPWNPVQNFGKQGCFVRFSPTPQAPPLASGEVTGVLTSATASLSFSEPMDTSSVSPFDTFSVTRVRNDPSATDYVVGQVNRTGDLLQFTFVPSLPFAKTATGAQAYFINVASGATGPTDLAGNPLLNSLPQVEFRMLASQPAVDTGGLALRFSSVDEIPDTNNGSEVRGQILYDFQLGIARPRPVLHSQAVADRTQLVPSRMPITPAGIQTPLSGLGSKLQTVWRYFDVGFGLLAESTLNMDIEGLWWAPRNGQVFLETYDLFEIGLAHSKWLPDESVDAQLLPKYAQSGLTAVYESNLLDPANDPLKIVHPRGRGYVINPNDIRQAPTGLQVMPYPLNRGLPVNQFTYYTWRDTSIQTLGGNSGSGADPEVLQFASTGTVVPPRYPNAAVPSIGLPILMEFRCFPTNEAIGLNGFDTNFAVNSSPRPNFRAFSTGGVDTSMTPQTKNPDNQTVADGGFNPNAGGAATPPADNTFYLGMLDLVSRVSRAHTIWFDTGSATASYAVPVVEPRSEEQPPGTSLLVAFRGADQVTSQNLRTDAACYIDPYGDPTDVCAATPVIPAPPTFHNNDAGWKGQVAQIQGSRFFQARLTFLANPQTSLVPSISSLGIAYTR